MPNSRNQHHKNCMVNSEWNYKCADELDGTIVKYAADLYVPPNPQVAALRFICQAVRPERFRKCIVVKEFRFNSSQCRQVTTKAFENSDKNAPLLVACISLFGCVNADDTFSSVNTELQTVQRNVKTLVSLGENGVLHFPNGIRTIFKLHY